MNGREREAISRKLEAGSGQNLPRQSRAWRDWPRGGGGKRDGFFPPRPASRFLLIASSRGVVLVAVLWCSAIIMWFAFQISAQTRLMGEDRLHAIRESHALYLAIGGCYEAIARMGQPAPLLLDRVRDADNWQPDGLPRVVEYNSGIAVVIVEPENLKINVNMVQAAQLIQVLQRAGVEDFAAEELADRILDFNHPGDIPRLHGMKKDGYLRAGLNYVPFEGPLTSLDQLLLVPGVSQQLFYGYDQAPDDRMRELPDIFQNIMIPGKNSLFNLLTIYGNNVSLPQDVGQQQEAVFKLMSWRPGGIYRILSFGKSASGPPSVCVWLTVSFSGTGDKPVQIISRKVL